MNFRWVVGEGFLPKVTLEPTKLAGQGARQGAASAKALRRTGSEAVRETAVWSRVGSGMEDRQ